MIHSYILLKVVKKIANAIKTMKSYLVFETAGTKKPTYVRLARNTYQVESGQEKLQYFTSKALKVETFWVGRIGRMIRRLFKAFNKLH
ncbi:hypothetical protein VB10N_14720 [Vibrio sp. 10N]|nr:hypothetical protein VB10N_14720 [Vibrio sp. 10N]